MMPPVLVLLICSPLLVLEVYVLGVTLFTKWRDAQRIQQAKRIVEKQYKKAQKFGENILPALWNAGASKEEILAAFEKYLRGEL